jgi:hypothetical protein
MSWNKQTSLDRITQRWESRDTEITVTKLTRLMNLENVTLRKGRLIRGAHVYATVTGTGQLHCLDTDDHARSSIQRLALWQAEVAKIAAAFEVPVIAFQGARVHLLVYRPIDDDPAIARKAALLGRAISLMTAEAFNPLFDEAEHLHARAASDLGQTVATRGGVRADSELLFLGNAANRPAKLLGGAKFVVTDGFAEALGGQLECELLDYTGDDRAKILKMVAPEVAAAVEADRIDWSIQASADRLAADLQDWPTERFNVSGASTLIRPRELSRSDSKLVDAAVIFVDIDGFSNYVDEAENDTVKREAIITLDAIRQEIRDVLKTDFAGVRIQYQGDNMVGLVHRPAGDPGKIAENAADIAAAIQSSMSVTLPQVVRDAERLHVAVGVAINDTVVACLGQYAKRNALVLGPAATKAEQIQMRLEGNQTGLDKVAYDDLPESIQTLYSWDASAKAYVASELDAAKQARVKESLSSNGQRTLTPDGAGRLAIGAAATAAGLAVGAVAARVSRSERVSSVRPYAS